MERSTNALEELAETIEEIKGLSVIRTMIHDEYTVALDKAQRIVAELAKVHIDEIKEDPFNALGAFVILMAECRAIAEEGKS